MFNLAMFFVESGREDIFRKNSLQNYVGLVGRIMDALNVGSIV